jgi:hypothetical protein
MLLSERAAVTLSFLDTIPNSGACEKCIAAYLGVDRYAALKIIRELIGAGSIRCSTHTECAICQERRLVARVRGKRTA